MPKRCIIWGCKSGSPKSPEHVPQFRVPKDDKLYAKWVKAVTPAINVQLKKTHSICEKHFHQSDIVREIVHKDGDGRIIAIAAYKQPRLMKTAVPSVFPSSPYQRREVTLPAVVKPRNDNELQQPINQQTVHAELIGDKKISSTATPSLVGSISENVFPALNNQSAMPVEKMDSDVDLITTAPISLELTPMTLIPEATNVISINENHSASEHAVLHIDAMSQDNGISSTGDGTSNSGSFVKMFIEIYSSANAAKLPLGWFRYTAGSGKRWVAFSTFDIRNEANSLQPVPQKSILLTEEGNVYISANGKGVPIERICRSLDRICSIEDLSRFLTTLASINLCDGIKLPCNSLVQSKTMHQNAFGEWRNKNCLVLCPTSMCSSCQRLRRSISERMRRLSKQPIGRSIALSYKTSKEKSKITMQRKLHSQSVFIGRAKERIEKLKNSVTELQDRIQRLERLERRKYNGQMRQDKTPTSTPFKHCKRDDRFH